MSAFSKVETSNLTTLRAHKSLKRVAYHTHTHPLANNPTHTHNEPSPQQLQQRDATLIGAIGVNYNYDSTEVCGRCGDCNKGLYKQKRL